ncbi:hypothetical protein EF904_24590, partial [Streptomyces sp. WAC05950]
MDADGDALLWLGLPDGAAGATLTAGADAFASSNVVSPSPEAGSTHTATAVPLRATVAAAPISSASGRRREAEPDRSSGPP